jgi:hypothetical protein
MKKFVPPFIICSLLLAICVISCDLFTGPKVNVLQKISDEKRWADAPQLTVRIEFPSMWGTSEPAQGNITQAMDIRLDYEFSVKFTPDSVYSLNAWMAFFTEDLEELADSGSWTENPDLIEEINSLGPDDITLPAPDPSGGIFKFTIHTVKPVTIVPSCDTRPRITRTEPLDIKSSRQPVSRANDIVLFFNGALNRSTVIPAGAQDSDGIWITAVDGDNVISNKDENWYSDPEYAAAGGFFTVTMNCLTLPPPESLMTVTINSIRNAQGELMDEAGYSFSWNTSSAQGIDFDSWSAKYIHNQDNTGNIEVSYKQTGADVVKLYYRQNRGSGKDIVNNIINGVTGPDYSGIRAGRQITGINEYEINIELYKEGIMENKASIKIWNIPGMSVEYNQAEDKETIIIPIRTAEELAAIKDNLDGQYVLANDITVTGVWTPIGTEDAPFTGKLYGNGHTVSFNRDSSIGGEAYRGLFGCVQGLSASQPAVIRDLTFEYNVNHTAPISVNVDSTDSYIGGVAGYLKDTEVSNVITSGGVLAVTASGDGDVSLGGIAGSLDDSFVANCRAGLNIELNRSGGISNVGAVVGSANGGSGGSIKININPGKSENYKDVYNLAIDKVTVTAKVNGITSGGALYIGGAAGSSSGNTMRDVIVSGQVLFNRTAITDGTSAGGVTGYAVNSNMEACSFKGGAFGGSGDIFGNIDDLKKKYVYLGGIIGFCETNSGNVYINNCLVRGNIKIDETNDVNNFNSGINIGGVLGQSEFKKGAFRINITNSFFEDGNITAACFSGDIQAGGFCGSFYEEFKLEDGPTVGSHNLNNCGVMAGTVNINIKNYGRYIYAGGFISQIWLGGVTSNCFSRANVISKASGGSDEEYYTSDNGDNPYSYTHQAGGFTGALAPGATLSSCYATGTVQSVHNGNRQLTTGGLVGTSGGNIENCYALGNVLADKTGGGGFFGSFAGGLVGTAWNGSIQYSFSAGQVIAQSKESGASAGGIWGEGPVINNTAALGKSVTAKSPYPESHPGRIATNINTKTSGNNYALITMTIEKGEYDSINPVPVPLEPGLYAKDGQNTSFSTFFTRAFWETTLQFSPDIWDFSRVARDGHPRLKNVEGQ